MNAIADIIDAAAEVAGHAAKWLLLAIAGLEIVALSSRAVFGLLWPGLGEGALVLNAVVVLFGGGTIVWRASPVVAMPAWMHDGKQILALAAGGLTVVAGVGLLAATVGLARGSTEPPAFGDALLVGAVAIFSCWLGLSGASAVLRQLTAAEAAPADSKAGD